MDVVKKMVEATEAAIVAQTSFKKLDVSLGDVTNPRQDYTRGFAVRPTALSQLEGGVGFIFFEQNFEIMLFDKLAFRGDSREKIFNLYQELDKLFKALYALRVTGDGYQVVLTRNLNSTAPMYEDNFVRLSVVFSALYKRQNVF